MLFLSLHSFEFCFTVTFVSDNLEIFGLFFLTIYVLVYLAEYKTFNPTKI